MKCICYIIVFCMGSIIYAEGNLYLGANAYVAAWTIGMTNIDPIKLTDFESTLTKKTIVLPLLGLNASYVLNRSWALSYSGSIGFSRFDLSYTAIREAPRVAKTQRDTGTYTPGTNILRIDNDLALVKILGSSGFITFLGAKIQHYNFSGTDSAGSNRLEIINPAGGVDFTTTVTVENTVKFKFTAIGPSVGFGYSYRLNKIGYLSGQLGYLFMIGSSTMDYQYKVPSKPSENGNTKEDNLFNGHGGTLILSFIKPYGYKYMLQFAYRLQFFAFVPTEKISARFEDDVGTAPIFGSQSSDVNNSALNNAIDIFQGISVAFVAKIF